MMQVRFTTGYKPSHIPRPPLAAFFTAVENISPSTKAARGGLGMTAYQEVLWHQEPIKVDDRFPCCVGGKI